MTDVKIKKVIIKHTLLLLIGLLISWWLFFFAPFEIPEKIPFLQVKIDGLILVAFLLTTLIVAQKNLLKLQSDISIIKLTFLGSVICFFAEVIFQTIRQPTLNTHNLKDNIFYFLYGVIGITFFCVFFSFLIAFQLKTKKTVVLIIMIIGLAVLTSGIKYLLGAFTK